MPDGGLLSPARSESTAALRWLIDTDVSTLMRLAGCPRYDIEQAKKLARAELTKRDLVALYEAAQALRGMG